MLIVIAAVALAAAGPNAPETSRIIVEGWGTVTDKPTVAALSYDVRGEGTTNDQALADLASKTGAVERALRAIDPSLQLTSDSVSVRAVRGKDCEEDRYAETVHLSTGGCAIKGYVALQDFNIKTGRVADAGTLVGLAGRHGAYNPTVDSFQLANVEGAKRRAIAAAMTEARKKAEAVAAGSSARLGPIIAVSLDNARDSAEIIVTSAANAVPPPAAERDEPIPISVTPKPVETNARVSVTYAIAGPR